MTGPDLRLEEETGGLVAGVDEAGRGPWAGPVVAAAVVLDRAQLPEVLDDSKKLSARRREALFEAIMETARVGIGIAEVAEIDALNILRANDLAMCRAVDGLAPALRAVPPPAPTHPPARSGAARDAGELSVLIDGNRVPPGFPVPAQAIVKGDARSLSIAAASIIAKVTRDRIMDELAAAHPGYGWESNRGYGTAAHREALLRLGPTPHHRVSFRPVRDILV
ncbi:MAG: ribonuclease HII [Pseudomonadota bacterium]